MSGPLQLAPFEHVSRPPSVRSRRKRVRAVGEKPRVGVIYNPRSHRNKGRDFDTPVRPDVFISGPGRRDELPGVLAEFADKGVDYLIVNGGDGTVRDVLTCGEPVFGNAWPEMAFLPKGKTNALNVDLGAPADWNLADALTAFEAGRRVVRRPMMIAPAGGGGAAVQGFILGAGAFTVGVEAGQDAHRMGAFNSLAVAVATGWGVLQTLLGSDRNRWRRGIEAEILLHDSHGTVTPLPRGRHGDPKRRGLLLASTLEQFPMNAKPFASAEGPIRLAVMDTMRRRLMALLPFLLTGYDAEWLRRAGLHRAGASAMEMRLAGRFILDGEAFPAGNYTVRPGPEIAFVVP